VRSLAQALSSFHHSTQPLTTPEGFESFFTDHGLDPRQLQDGLYHIALAEPLRESGSSMRNLTEFLVRDYHLLEQWILARRGADHLLLLFGTYRPVPWFAGSSGIPVQQHLDERYSSEDLRLPEIPFEGVLVDDGRELYIARRGVADDAEQMKTLLERYRHC
jgi:hypothetical protein